MQRSNEYSPASYYKAFCFECDWNGYPGELLCEDWEDYRYCPGCDSDNTHVYEYVFNMRTCEYENKGPW